MNKTKAYRAIRIGIRAAQSDIAFGRVLMSRPDLDSLEGEYGRIAFMAWARTFNKHIIAELTASLGRVDKALEWVRPQFAEEDEQ